LIYFVVAGICHVMSVKKVVLVDKYAS